MKTYHLHIEGIVQGVGFRPFVYKLALLYNVMGTACNTNDGVHIEYNINEEVEHTFLREILKGPKNAVITGYQNYTIPYKEFKGFKIIESNNTVKPNVLLTPDIALCEDCKKEISDQANKRYQYAFTTCLNCGPRYSIIDELPYDRPNTTMQHIQMCKTCNGEYNDVSNRRHYSQTNSCKECAIPIHIFQSKNKEIFFKNDDAQLSFIVDSINQGKICAIKGVGGYLLVCDATNENTIKELRARKHRPVKPLALMYPTIEMAVQDVEINDVEEAALKSIVAPIVICKRKHRPETGICIEQIAPHLDKIGLMPPYSPLLYLIVSKINKPIIATSANISGSPILYKDTDAIENLFGIADYILTFDREIVAPQDDSVIQFTKTGRRIILRRSRGLAPNYFPNPFKNGKPLLAMGAELKSAFALADKNNLYISQYLGNQESFESNESFKATLQHLQTLLKINPEKIIIDKHPDYNISNLGRQLAAAHHLPVTEVQHHLAHFAAVLGENDLINTHEKVLGIVWDGTGYGDDGQIWGGEYFLYQNKNFERVAHLEYFTQLAGDKMSREPRISALALLNDNLQLQEIKKNFNEKEFDFYVKFLQKEPSLLTSSMGRFIDGIANLLDIIQLNGFEGEAAMKLEALARSCRQKHFEFYDTFLKGKQIIWRPIIEGVTNDKKQGVEIEYIARKVFVSLVKMIELIIKNTGVHKIAFSGGVFQNVFLVDLIEEMWSNKFEIFWHKKLSPNDECISFGQLVYEKIKEK